MEQLCLIFPDQSNQLEFDFSEKEVSISEIKQDTNLNLSPKYWIKKKSSLECRAKKCPNELRPDYTSQLDDRYCLDCMPW